MSPLLRSARLNVATERDADEMSRLEDARVAELTLLPFPSRWLNDGDGPIMERSISVLTGPWCATSEETDFSSPKSRGTPKPAESLRKVKVPGAETLETASGRVFTGTIAGEPGLGGAGADAKPRPPPVAAGIRAAVFCSPLNAPPGCHPQPAPPQLTQLPEWNGSQPQGYGDTQE